MNDSYVQCGQCDHQVAFVEVPEDGTDELSFLEALLAVEGPHNDGDDLCEAVNVNGEQLVHLATGEEYLVRIRPNDAIA